jgi:hypothetical protein
MVKLVILLNKFPYAKNINSDEEEAPKKEKKYQKDIRKGTKRNSLRKTSTQKKTVPHQMRMMIVTVTQKECSSWQWKLRKEPMKMMNNIMKKVK